MRATDMLPDGVNQREIAGTVVRKGSVAAFLANARVLADPQATSEARYIAESDLRELLPTLRALGLFDVLEIRDATLRAFVDAQL